MSISKNHIFFFIILVPLIFDCFSLEPSRQCSDSKKIDLSTSMPPVRNQDSVGFCFAYTASDLINYEIIRNNKLTSPFPSDKLISPFAMAIENFQEKDMEIFLNDDRIQAGDSPKNVLNLFLKKGGCNEQSVSSRTSSNKKIIDALHSIKSVTDSDCVECNLPKEMLELMPNLKNHMNIYDKYIKGEKDPNIMLKKMMRASCIKVLPDENIKKLKSINLRVTKSRTSSAFNTIDRELSNGKPLAIKISPAVYVTNGEGYHSVLVVGKQLNENCEEVYKIRNSWGKSCAYYKVSNNVLKTRIEACGATYITKNELKVLQENALKYPQDREYKMDLFQPQKIVVVNEIAKSEAIFKCESENVNNDVYQVNGITCDSEGYLYITKNRLKDYLYGLTYLGRK